ncbi:MAG: hypothetical protein ACRELV_11595 [Longimicrobiales bacterium]
MQTTIAVHCTRRPRTSLRDAIVSDDRLADYRLRVLSQQKPGRNPGWAKLSSTQPDVLGVINIEWDPAARMLVARAVTRDTRPPAPLIGHFIEYLLARYPRRIRSIVTSP